MAEHHMSAREAWEWVRDGKPDQYEYGHPDQMPSIEWLRMLDAAQARYTRACAIVEACVKEHEAGDAYFAHAYNMPTDPVASNWYKRKEELERAWRNAALAVRALAAQERAS